MAKVAQARVETPHKRKLQKVASRRGAGKSSPCQSRNRDSNLLSDVKNNVSTSRRMRGDNSRGQQQAENDKGQRVFTIETKRASMSETIADPSAGE